MNGIYIREDEALKKRFGASAIVRAAGILSDIKKFRHYEKPSEERKRRINSSNASASATKKGSCGEASVKQIQANF